MLNGNRTKSERKRSPRDFYQTPIELATASLSALHEDEMIFNLRTHRWLDAGCGTGVWGEGLFESWVKVGKEPSPFLYGIDILPDVDIQNSFYYFVDKSDFLLLESKSMFDVVFGNPPYSLAEEFVNHAYNLIGLNDYIFFLLRLSFLEGIKRGRGLFKNIPLKRVYVCSRRPSFFSSNGKHTTDTLSYGMFLWQKGFRGQPTISFLDWDYDKTI